MRAGERNSPYPTAIFAVTFRVTPDLETDTQTAFLQLIRDPVMTSFRFERDDLDYAPFDAQGGLGKMHQLFGDQRDDLIEQLNGELVS